MVPDWLVLADDRTGALEVAGQLAASLGPVRTIVHRPCDALSGDCVVDLGSRHLAEHDAAERARAWCATPARRRLHKIDSTLRGRWAAELVAVGTALRQRVVVVPALPRLGRTCIGGVVHVDGRPLRLDDARHGRTVAEPAALLGAAGATAVAGLGSVAALDGWLAGAGEPFAVCDAASDADLDAIGARWRASDGVVFAGTSASVAAAVGGANAAAPVALGRPAVVVVGSLHPVARAQAEALAEANLQGVELIASPAAAGRLAAPAADRAAADLARMARRRLDRGDVDTLILVGGDTAAAVLGDEPLVAGGTVAPGIPWARRPDGDGPLVVTKAGGFGGPQTLVDLLAGRHGDPPSPTGDRTKR